MARSIESKNIKALRDELERSQRIEIGILDEDSETKRLIRKYAAIKSLYTDPKELQKMIDVLDLEIMNYVKSARNRGKLLGEKAIEKFLLDSERKDFTRRQLAIINKLSQRKATERLSVYSLKLQKEKGILKSDIEIFLKNGKIAGYTEKELLAQLTKAAESKVGIAEAMAKRTERIIVEATRREMLDAKFDEYLKVAGPEDEWQWITISVNPCPDCEPRAGVILTLSQWQEQGLPREGRTICGQSCRCELMPLTIAEEQFPTVKQFEWNPKDTVLATKSELNLFKKNAKREN
jgi:hypothetical protein